MNICIYKLLLVEVYGHKCLIYLAFDTPGIGVFFMIGVPSTPNSNALIVLFELYWIAGNSLNSYHFLLESHDQNK